MRKVLVYPLLFDLLTALDAERVPVVFIAGSPPRDNQRAKLYLHHTLGNGDFEVFTRVAREFTVAQAVLMDPEKASSMIDSTLRKCIMQSRPVYIQLPDDLADTEISAAPLSTAIDLSFPPNDPSKEDAIVSKLLEKIYSAKQPVISVDGNTSRYGFAQEADVFVQLTGFPTATTPFGKGILDETTPNFHGVYNGAAGKLNYSSWYKSCDLVIRFGPCDSNINTLGFSALAPTDVRMDFDFHSVSMSGLDPRESGGIYVKELLRKLITKLDKTRLRQYDTYPDLGSPQKLLDTLSAVKNDAAIDQDTFFQRVSSFFRSGDVILTETGTPSVGGREFVLPPRVSIINSTTWLSIGYMLPSSQGVALALRDIAAGRLDAPPRRTILFQGDGSLQMTVQELSTVIRKKLNLTFFLINNDGYVIERFIHGMKAGYNDIAAWRYLEAPNFLGAPNDGSYPVHTFRAENWGELNATLSNESFCEGSGLKIVEIIMGREDAPESLKKMQKAKKELDRKSKAS